MCHGGLWGSFFAISRFSTESFFVASERCRTGVNTHRLVSSRRENLIYDGRTTQPKVGVEGVAQSLIVT